MAHLLIGIGPAGAELNPAIGKLVHHGYPLSDAHWMVVGQNRDPESYPNVLGALAKGAHEHLRTGRPRKSHEEVMLHKPQVIEANFVCKLTLVQRLPVEAVPINIIAFEGPLRLEK